MATIPSIIGLTGKKGCGKSTVAEILLATRTTDKSTYDYNIKIGFSDPIKRAVRSMLASEFDYQTFEKSAIARPLHKTFRYLYQTLGTEWGRKTVDPLIWVKLTMPRLLEYLEQGLNIVVTDIRFLNEAHALRSEIPYMVPEATVQIWRITRPQEYDPKDRTAKHESETELERIQPDITIVNDSTIAHLASTVHNILQKMHLGEGSIT